MGNNRRDFLKKAGLAGLGLTGGGILNSIASVPGMSKSSFSNTDIDSFMGDSDMNDENVSLIGTYGEWAASLIEGELPAFSYRREEWKDLKSWQKSAKERFAGRLATPDIGGFPEVTVENQFTYDGLHIEELSWQLPYGRPAEGILLKPLNVRGQLPGILAFHDHGGNKYFGKRKITRTSDNRHPLIEAHQEQYYENMAWANAAAKRGYAVLVPDAFPFASRRVLLENVPDHLRNGLNDQDPENPANIRAYNDWAGRHESVMARSLFSAGTTWPGVFFAEDRKALDILCSQEDVDENRVGCGGLSGGGMRTVFMSGMDSRIKCAVCVGFMTTWKDLIVAKSFTHTWMTYVPLLPNELDFPEILGLNVPQSTLVLNCIEDGLFTLSDMKIADKILQYIYDKAGATDRYHCSFHPGGHKFDKPMQAEAFDWFDNSLKD
jgi:dienelactone hydrolase